jgi:hypothetical protein
MLTDDLCRWETRGRVAAMALGFLACAVVPAGADPANGLFERHLAGVERTARFEVGSFDKVVADEDLVVLSSGDIVINGPIVAGSRTEKSRTGQGVSITLSTPKTIYINAEILPGRGVDASAACLPGGQGGSLILDAARIVIGVPEIRAGAGGAGGPEAPGGAGGDFVVGGRLISRLPVGARARLVGGAGGPGGPGMIASCKGIPANSRSRGGKGGDFVPGRLLTSGVQVIQNCIANQSPADPLLKTDGSGGDGGMARGGGDGGAGGKGSDGTASHPDGYPGNPGGPGGSITAGNAFPGGPGSDGCCVTPHAPGGNGGPGGKGGTATGGNGGAGGAGGNAYTGGRGGDGGAGGNGGSATGGNGGAGGAGGNGNGPGAGGGGGAGGTANKGFGGAGGAGGSGTPSGNPGAAGSDGTAQSGLAGVAGANGSPCS